MTTVSSADGTPIPYEVTGDGPPLIIVDGAMCYRDSGPSRPLAQELKSDFTVFTYDRRGRGASPGAESTPAREVEDLAALAKEAGGSPYVFGASSGAVLALEAVNSGVAAVKLALYEPPLIVSADHAPAPASALADMRALVAADRRSDAVVSFMRSVDVPGFVVTMMKLFPVWKKLKAVAHTLPNDLALLEGMRTGKPLPEDSWTAVTAPTLVADGGKSPAYMRASAANVASVLPNATYETVPGQTHIVKAKVLAPVLRDFFLA